MTESSETTNYKQALEKYKVELIEVASKSQDSFEKQLSFISSGAIGLSIVFLEKLVKSEAIAKDKWIIEIGWLMLSATLLINLISHLVTTGYNFKTIREIDLKKFDYKKVESRRKRMSGINILTSIMLFLGITLIIIFVSINF